MKTNLLLAWIAIFACLSSTQVQAQNLAGTNVAGQGTNFTITVAAGETNLSLVVSNSAASYSSLYLTKGGTPTTNSYQFASRLTGLTNQINLESPEFSTGTYGLLVYTPATSATEAFKVTVTSNRTDLRTVSYPVIKPLVFSTTGTLTNSGSGAWQYFQVDMPATQPTGWRLVLSTNGPGGNPDLYVRRGALPTAGSYDKASYNQVIDTITFTAAEATNATYFIGVYLAAGTASSTSYTLSAELASITTLTWDPGTTDAGTQVFSNLSTTGGDYYFAITTMNTADGVWRTALNVQSNEADIYLEQGTLPSTLSYNYFSARTGSDGFVLAQGTQFSAGQNWFYVVHATPGAKWNLVSGEAYVQQLPALAADASSGTNATMGAEGMHFFKTTITTNTLAWRLGLNGLTNQLLVKTTAAPIPYNTSSYDLTQAGQMLVVPSYLTVGNQYFVGVVGAPGLNFTLDSRQQLVTALPFNYTNVVSATNYGYTTFVVQVPVQQIAWQVNVTPSVNAANVAVRNGNVPNEFVNDAFSEPPAGAGASVTLVPPTLSNGTFYLTVYGPGTYTVTLANGQPVITTVDYVFSITNDAPSRVGWRYYTVINTAEQLGSLGWELDLSNQPPGTEIAIRRNAVPGSWTYRNNPLDYFGSSVLSYVDFSGTLGYLQQPNHQSDVWYIGIYSPTNALGNFVLTGSQLTGPTVAFDGASSSQSVTNQPAGKYQFFTFTVPTNALGWDIRLTNATVGAPQLYVCKDQLPYPANPNSWYPYYSVTWPSGYQWAATYDWTGDTYDSSGVYRFGQVLEMGMGNPLQPGTYYAGVVSTTGTNPISYTLVSRGIGSNLTIPVTPLSFAGGTTSSNLLGRESAYYSVVVPSNQPSWRVRLGTNIGESLLMVEENYLPNVNATSYASTLADGGRKMQKVGNEQYLLLPASGQSNLNAGTYYLGVASEGQNPASGYLGTGSSSYTLTSYGNLTVSNMGSVDKTGATDILVTNTAEAGQMSAFPFVVPAGTLAIQVTLENRVGNPIMTLRADNQFADGTDNYGIDGGQSYTWTSPTLINIPNPVATNYTLMVQAVATGGDASYRIRIHAQVPQPVVFDGGSTNVTGQAAGVWQYFTVVIPTNALGWDIRLTNATVGNPQVYVCKDELPSTANPNGWYPYLSTNWLSNYQWAAGYDWTGDVYDLPAIYRYGQILQMGTGNPLVPGTYYVGVISTTGTNAINYTLLSRGIGTNLTIPVTSLSFSNGVISSNLPGREAAYYSVVVPANQPSWRLRLGTNIGESLLLIQKDYLPSVSAAGSPPTSIAGGRKMQRTGNEQYLLMPAYGQTNLVAGTYYLGVASEGQNPGSSYLGSNSSSYTLNSYGNLAVSNVGTVDNTGATDIVVTNSAEAGQISVYQFAVPAGTLSLEVLLENRVGNPTMTLLTGNQLPSASDSYGVDGGQSYSWNNTTLINIPNPTATNYTLMVQAVASGGNASYDVRIHALGPVPVTFDGGSSVVTNQAIGTWQYFVVNIPSNALGWDVRINGATNGNPSLYVCKDQSPSQSNPNGWYPYLSTNWPTDYQWMAGYDWTGYVYDNNGVYRYGQILQMGMGNPLVPGTYYVGVISTTGTTPLNYTLQSRGIGSNMSLPVITLPFSNGIATNLSLNGREAAYYNVVVPTNVPNWKLRLSNISGESMMSVQKDYLPNVSTANFASTTVGGGHKLQKAGNEQYLLLPPTGQANVIAGNYYILVGSEGQNPAPSYLGTNSSSYSLTSFGSESITNLGLVGGADIYSTNTLQGGEDALFQFSIPPGLAAVEVRLDNVTGYPYMTMAAGGNEIFPYNTYGYDSGTTYAWSSPSLITLANPTATNYSLTVQASLQSGLYPNAIDTVHIREMPTPNLVFDASLNGSGASNVSSGTLLNGESAFYQVTVPSSLNGQPVIGWKLDVTETSGTATLRVRPGLTPDDLSTSDGTSPFSANEAIIVPPYLTPGTWYVEVRGAGLTSYTLTSHNLLLNRGAWAMPVQGNPVVTPGIPANGPLFGDTGIDTNGVALGGDQGTDLAAGNFDYYAVTVPPGNIGVMRTRLDAISGNPNMYIRVGDPSTLSHYLNGGSGANVYDRSLSASVGSEYGNWVPINGRYEPYLTNGTWYLAVQAGGGANVRYRLRVYTGTVTNLTLNGGSFTNQTVAAGDWLYYAVTIPTNAPQHWSISFTPQLGNAVMYLRDRVPPGQGISISDYKDWVFDDKNHSTAYANYPAAGTYTFNTPPVRPNNTYYVGFRAVTDTTFSVSSSTNGGTIDYTNTVAFYNGALTTNVAPYGTLKLRVDVPSDARRLIMNFTNVAPFNLYLDQGSVPARDGTDPWQSIGSANPVLNEALYTQNGWPWLGNYMYFLLVTNTTASTQTFTVGVDGLNCSTDDADNDGLPDCWELTYFPSIYSYGPNDDPDGDGVRNLDEYLEGTDPTNPLSFHPRLLVTNLGSGSVALNPAGNATTTPPKLWYTLGQTVQLTATGGAGYGFLSWGGDASGTNNPLSLVMSGHRNVTALFGVTNKPNADYQFQNNLHSSVGTPPDLTNIAAGNTFITDTVDGVSTTVYHFPASSSVELTPANTVIPSNIYTAVLLFRFDTVSGYRRILDVKNPPADIGLYDSSGYLSFYPIASGTTAPIAISNYVQVVLTRDAASNVTGYVNGVQQFSFVDTGNYSVLSGATEMLRFFKDDATEDSGGAVARIRLYNTVMPAGQIATLDRLPGTIPPPHFLTPYSTNGVLNLPATLTPGYAYRLQYSTNLLIWQDLTTNTPATSPYTFQDVLGPIYPARFYRLVTP